MPKNFEKIIIAMVLFFLPAYVSNQPINQMKIDGQGKQCEKESNTSSANVISSQNELKEVKNKSKIEMRYDLVLNEIYGVLREELDHEAFLKLRKNQRNWIKLGKGAHLESKGRSRGYYGCLSSIENGYALKINELFKKYMPFIKSGLLKKLKNIENENGLPDGIRYAISWLIIHNNYEIAKTNENPDGLKELEEEQAGYSLCLGKNLTAILAAPNLWLWAGRFIDYYCITNRHRGVMSFHLIDLNNNTVTELTICCPKKFDKLAFYDGETCIEATCVSSFNKNCICVDVIDYRNKKAPEERIWLTFDLEKKTLVITKHEEYKQYKEIKKPQ